jgi:tetratricopeptide (TPR) repeat protein
MISLLRSRQLILSAIALVFVLGCSQPAPAQADDLGDETDPIRLFERGQNAHAKSDLARAVALYEAALKLRPEFPEAEYQRGIALVGLERPADAEKAFARAIELRKDWVLPYSALGNLLARLSRDKEGEVLLRRALQLGAKDFLTLDALSTIRLRAGDKVEALALARRGTEDTSAPASAWVWRGVVERAAGDVTSALKSLDRALQIDANHVGALRERAEVQVDAADYSHAIEDLKAALAVKPDDKPISLRLANVYDLAGKSDEAQRIYQSMGVTRPSPPPGGRAFDQMIPLIDGTSEEIDAANSDDAIAARSALEKLLAKNPKVASLWARLGEVSRRNDPQKSAEAYRRANELDPKNPKYAIGYAAALVQMRRFAEAEQILRRVIATAPNEYTAHANLALALYELKRFAEALPEYEWLAATRPEIPATYFFIATAHDNLGEYEQALEAYEKFLARADPNSNKLDIEKINLRLPRLRDQLKRGQGVRRKKP